MVDNATTVKSPLEEERGSYQPLLPPLFRKPAEVAIEVRAAQQTSPLKEYFPHTHAQPFLKITKGALPFAPLKIGVLFSGGPAPGGHNVISGLFDAMQSVHPGNLLFGFLKGPEGLIENQYLLLTKAIIDRYRNLGGFEMIGSGRTKIATAAQFEAAAATAVALDLDGLVIVGGDDSNTNAAFLTEEFIARGVKAKVIGVPKTIDGDLRNQQIELSFGFDSATKIYSELIGNLTKDALSTKKYTHFVKLMGRSASHVTLECALQTQPNLAFIGEELLSKGWGLKEIVGQIADLIEERKALKKNYGVILIPEGLLEFIADGSSLMEGELDPHGNVQLSHIETEKLLIAKTKEELQRRSFQGSFHPIAHFFGYEGRAGFPSNFDLNYCTALGYAAYTLIRGGYTGYIASIQGLAGPVEEWQVGGTPLVSMIHLEERQGKMKCVIAKKLVDLNEEPFLTFLAKRERWRLEDPYLSSGPIQFYGPSSNAITHTLRLSKKA